MHKLQFKTLIIGIFIAFFFAFPAITKAAILPGLAAVTAFWAYEEDVKKFIDDVNNQVIDFRAATGDERSKMLQLVNKAKENTVNFNTAVNNLRLQEALGRCSSPGQDFSTWVLFCGNQAAELTQQFIDRNKDSLSFSAQNALMAEIRTYNKYKNSRIGIEQTKAKQATANMMDTLEGQSKSLDSTITALNKAGLDLGQQIKEDPILKDKDGKPIGEDPSKQCNVGFFGQLGNLLTFNFGCALLGAVTTTASWLDYFVKTFSGFVNASITSDNIATDPIKAAWLVIRNLALSLLAIAVVIIAFANVLSIDIKTYGVQSMIPKLVIAIIMTYFSFFIAQLLVDFANVLTTQLFNTMKGLPHTTDGIRSYAITQNVGSNIITALVLFLGMFLLMGALLYLAIILLARVVVVNLLIIIAPIAFILGIMPFTAFLQKQWWENFTKWVFMGPAVMFMILVGNVIVYSLSVSSPTITGDVKVDNGDSIFIVMSAAIAYFLAAQLPMSMGNKALDVAGKVKGAGAFGMKKTGLSGMWEQRKDAGKAADTRRATKLRARIGGGADGSKAGSWTRRWAAGYGSEVEAQTAMKRAHLAEVADKKKLYEHVDHATISEAINSKNAVDEQASFGVLASRGSLDPDDARHQELISKYARRGTMARPNPNEDPSIGKDVLKENWNAAIANKDLENLAVNIIGKGKKITDLTGSVGTLAKSTGGVDEKGERYSGGQDLLRKYTPKDMEALFGAQGNDRLRGEFEKLIGTTILNTKAEERLSELLRENRPEQPHHDGGQNPPGGGQNPQPPPPGNPPHQA